MRIILLWRPAGCRFRRCQIAGSIAMLARERGNREMAYKITDECTMCGSCVNECAFEAISEGDPKYVIDADTCTDCGACEAMCPSGAIVEG